MTWPKTSNHRHRTRRRTIGSIQRHPLSHFESEYFTFGRIDRIADQRRKNANDMNIFVLTFLGWYQYQTFTLFLGAVKRNWNISWLCFERSWLWNFPDKCQVVNFWHKVKSEDQDHWQYYGQEIWKENLLLFVDIWSIVDFHIYWGFVWSYFPLLK